MKNILFLIIVIIPSFLFSQIELTELFYVENDFSFNNKINIQLLDSYDDGQPAILLSGATGSQIIVSIYTLNGELIFNYQNELEFDEIINETDVFYYENDLHLIYLGMDSKFIWINLSNDTIIFEDYITDSEGEYLPFGWGSIFLKLKTFVLSNELYFMISGRSFYEMEGGGYYFTTYTPYLYIFNTELSCVTQYENCDAIYFDSNIATGTYESSLYSPDEDEFSQTSWIYQFDNSVFPFEFVECQQLDTEIDIVSSDDEINNEYGFVYSTFQGITSFYCLLNNNVIWENNQESFCFKNSTNVKINDQNYLFIMGNYVLIINHVTGEIVHFEPNNLNQGRVLNPVDDLLILAGFTYVDSTPVISFFQVDSINFNVETENVCIEHKKVNVSNFPNPFNPETTISFNLNSPANVNLSIYNVKGQKVKTLRNEILPQGLHQIIWNGKNDNCTKNGSGIYFIKLRINGFDTSINKCILMK